jgi:hypothetical protein
MGRIAGLKKQQIINTILEKTSLAGYSQRRNLASIDAFRNAVARTGSKMTNQQLFELYQKFFRDSPYPVKGSKRRETWWKRRKPETPTSKMGKKIERQLRKHRHPT